MKSDLANSSVNSLFIIDDIMPGPVHESEQATFLLKRVHTNLHFTKNKLFDTYIHSILAYNFKNTAGYFNYNQLYTIANKYELSYRKLIQAVNSLKSIGIITKENKWHIASIKAIGKRARTLNCSFDLFCAAIAAKAYKQSLWFFKAVEDKKTLTQYSIRDRARFKLVLAFKSGDEYENWSRSNLNGPCALSNIAKLLLISIPSAWKITKLAEIYSFISKDINLIRCKQHDKHAFYNKSIAQFTCYKASSIFILA